MVRSAAVGLNAESYRTPSDGHSLTCSSAVPDALIRSATESPSHANRSVNRESLLGRVRATVAGPVPCRAAMTVPIGEAAVRDGSSWAGELGVRDAAECPVAELEQPAAVASTRMLTTATAVRRLIGLCLHRPEGWHVVRRD